jgi:Prealbumin-like fold domain
MYGGERLNGPTNDSNGVWQQSRVDPPLPDKCGLRVALIIDWSTSVAGQEAQLRAAADALVDTLSGTPSETGGPPGYTASAWDCTTGGVPTDGVTDDTVPMSDGANVTCTITNSFTGEVPGGDDRRRAAGAIDVSYE